MAQLQDQDPFDTSDLTIISGPDQIELPASSHIIGVVSSVWREMLRCQMSKRSKELYLPDDHADAMSIVVHIAHHEYDWCSESPSVELVLELAKLCNKYELVRLLSPFASNWQAIVFSEELTNPATEEMRMFFAWVFGYQGEFENLWATMICQIQEAYSGKLMYKALGSPTIRAMGQSWLPVDVLPALLSARIRGINNAYNICSRSLRKVLLGVATCQLPETAGKDTDFRETMVGYLVTSALKLSMTLEINPDGEVLLTSTPPILRNSRLQTLLHKYGTQILWGHSGNEHRRCYEFIQVEIDEVMAVKVVPNKLLEHFTELAHIKKRKRGDSSPDG